MSEVVRRSIDELIARYQLEPSLNDVYVEGIFDLEIFMTSIESEYNNTYIYTIDSICVPRDILVKYNLTLGNKQRVMALAKELDHFLNQDRGYICFVDKDLDHWFDLLETVSNLRWSRYTSIELHFFEIDFLKHLLVTTCRGNISDFEKFFNSLAGVLQTIYALRCADKKLNLNLSWIDFAKSITINDDLVTFDFKIYLTKLLNKNKKFSFYDQVSDEVAFFIDKFSNDFKQSIHGHDFVELVSICAIKTGGIKAISSPESIYRLMIFDSRHKTHISSEIT